VKTGGDMTAAPISRVLTFAALFAIGASVAPARAVDGIWMGPGTEWTTGTNWSSTPTVPDNTAIFQNNLAPTSLTISANASINTIQLDAGAPAYSFINNTVFNINGTGIVNNSASAPSFANNNVLFFNNASTAGNATINNNQVLRFFNTATAGNATITNSRVVAPERPDTVRVLRELR
jgi:hypothetical protein